MFDKLNKTAYPPERPLMVYDGNCGFCHYWVLRWNIMTDDAFDYEPYEDAHQQFPDIEKRHFVEAGRLIEPNGRIYTGAGAAYRACYIAGRDKWLWNLYKKGGFFQKISDVCYNFIAQNRPFMMKVTSLAFGKNPRDSKPFWMLYILALLVFISSLKMSKKKA